MEFRSVVYYSVVSLSTWAAPGGSGTLPDGIWACNGAYIFGHYNDEDCILESSIVVVSPTIPLSQFHLYSGVK